jgi:homoserine dehydrogenase
MKVFNIGIIGLGNIGLEVYKNLKKNSSDIQNKTGFKLKILKVSARNINKKRGVSFTKNVFEKDPFKIVRNPNVHIIIEMIGGADGIAKRVVFESIKQNKHVVTANKALIAKHGDELSILSEKHGVNLLFEAAVGGGIPIIRSVKQGLIANKLHHIYGILNGTTNYILTEMEKRNENFPNVLKDAQRLGYAESNPTADVDGYDVADKISILSSIGFGTKIINKGFVVEGIRNIEIEDIKFAGELGYKIKLLAIAEKIKNQIKQRVHPCLIPFNIDLANIDNVTNAVVVDGNPIGRTVYEGPGAGKGPTSSAVISDVTSIMLGGDEFSFGLSPSSKKKMKLFNFDNHQSKYYIRFLTKDVPGVLSKITSNLAKNKISIANLIQKPSVNRTANVMLITHSSKELNIQKVLKLLSKQNELFKKIVMIRVRDFKKL